MQRTGIRIIMVLAVSAPPGIGERVTFGEIILASGGTK